MEREGDSFAMVKGYLADYLSWWPAGGRMHLVISAKVLQDGNFGFLFLMGFHERVTLLIILVGGRRGRRMHLVISA